MYQVTVKGNSIEELKKAVQNVHAELNGQSVTTDFRPHLLISKSLLEEDSPLTINKDEMEEVESPYAARAEQVQALTSENTVESEGELDSEHCPWDERIHAASKNKNKDGTWRERRNVSDEVIAKIKNEIRRPAPKADPVLIPEFAKSIPLTPPDAVLTTPVASGPSNAPLMSTTPALPPMPTMSQGHTLATFSAKFTEVLAQLITEGKINQDYVNQLKEFFKLDEIWKASDEQKKAMFDQWTSPEWNLIQRVG